MHIPNASVNICKSNIFPLCSSAKVFVLNSLIIIKENGKQKIKKISIYTYTLLASQSSYGSVLIMAGNLNG